jgi:cysteine-rich repeat protein
MPPSNIRLNSSLTSSLADPTCTNGPGGGALRFSTNVQTNPLVPLPCENWSVSGGGFRYSDKSGASGGVQKILYKLGKLIIKVKGASYAPAIHGPAAFAEVRFRVGTQSLCGRFTTFAKNDAAQLSGKGPSAECVVICGDGIAEGDETCDDGDAINGNGCDNNCRTTGCGNGLRTAGEACDDGNAIDGDGCDNNCTVTGCGNGIQSASEQCDDGNVVNGDGCDNNCTPTSCGNGVQTVGEGCDDGNQAAGDGCRADCTPELCGDTVLDAGEQCDDGNLDDGDCCSSACTLENGQPCSDGDLCTTNDVCVAGTCVGAAIAPWINEFDYDDFRLGGNQDSDELIEIAGAAGTDLSGYQIISVEGQQSCNTPFPALITNGNAHFVSVLPPGTVLNDDTGTGIGFLVVCFTGSSSWYVGQGKCDLVLPAPFADTNLQNGNLLNADGFSCPDGILLRAPLGQFVDAISYEGQVPNVGAYGSYFHITPYNAGQDRGWKNGVSFEKTSSTLSRATSAAEWHLSGGCTFADVLETGCTEESASPGQINPGQSLHCSALFCGDGVVSPGEECDAGAANSDAPNAACRTDCTLRRCGDGVIDPSAAPDFPEVCETNADCGGGQVCFACQCESAAAQLGPLPFSVVPGPSDTNPPDDGQSTLLRVTPLFGITNGSQGNFNPGPLQLAAGAPDANGRAAFVLAAPALLSANLPSLAGAGRVCVRVRQDPDHLGHVDCDGGSAFGVDLLVDSQGAGPSGAPSLAVGGGSDAGPGGAVLRVVVEAGITDDGVTPCEDAAFAAPLHTAVTTATATSTIVNAQQGGMTTVSQSARPFNCSNWVENAGASLAGPNVNMDVTLPLGLGTVDIAQVLRLNDD